MRCLFLILVGAVQCARADTILNTLNIWNGSTSLCCFGTDQGAGTTGQTITVPATDSILTSFTLEIESSEGSNLPFYLYLARWNDNMITDPILYRSPLQSSGPTGTFISYTFEPNLSLVSGQMYILFAANGETDYFAHPGTLAVGYLGTDIQHGQNAYSGGSERHLPKGLPVSAWSTTRWLDPTDVGDTSANNDLAFSATFASAPVPEPASVNLALLGIAILGTAHGMKKQWRK
jgi:PEP-CTERM motif